MAAALTHQHVDDCLVWTPIAYVALMFDHMLASAVPDDWRLYDSLRSHHGSIKSPYAVLKKIMLRYTEEHLSVIALSE